MQSITLIPTPWDLLERSNAPRVFTGSGKNPQAITIDCLINFLRSNDIADERLKTSLQLSLLLDKQAGRPLRAPLAPAYEKVYTRWKENSPDGEVKVKNALPALIPSVIFHSVPSMLGENKKTVDPRTALRRAISFWSHSGIIGLDIDLKKKDEDTNPATTEELKRIAEDKLSHLPGYLFGYVSPSGGFKFFVQVDERAREALNILEPPEPLGSADSTDSHIPDMGKYVAAIRQARHQLICKYLWDQVYNLSGLTCDPACKDISRLQFLYHGELVERAKDTPQVFTVPSLDKLVERATKETVAPAAEDDLLTERDPLPILISEFPKWLDDNGYAEQAEGFRAMRWEGNHMYGMCPACASVCTGHRADRDLQFNIVRDFPSTSWFHCLHSSCQDKDRKVKSMNDLFRMYVLDIENRDIATITPPVTDAESESLLDKIYNPDAELKKILAETGPLPEGKAYQAKKPERWATLDFPMKDPKKDIVSVSFVNVSFLLASIGLRIVTDVANETKLVLDLVSRRLYPYDPEFVNHIAGKWASYLAVGTATSKLQHELDATFRSISTNFFYHPLASTLCVKPWDGIDRVGQYIRTLELEEGMAPEGYTEEEWLDFVLRTWLYTVLDHMEKSMEDVNNMCPIFCPIFIGSQGSGKSYWASKLLADYPGCFTSSFDIHNEKDAIVQKSSTHVIQLDEIDRILSNPEDANKVKNALDIQPAKTRAAYQRDQRMYKPKAVFIGTSNDPNPLTDATGNRRYSVLYVRSMGGDLATAKKVRDSIDIQQLWAQVYENYHSLSKDVSELVSMVVQKSQEINTKYGMRESAEESLVTQLRPVDWDVDTDKEGNPLWKHIPISYTGPQALLHILYTIRDTGVVTDQPRSANAPKRQSLAGFKTAITTYFQDEAWWKTKQVSGGRRRMRFLHVEDWLKYASDSTKARWYRDFPEWEEQDKQRQEVIVG